MAQALYKSVNPDCRAISAIFRASQYLGPLHIFNAMLLQSGIDFSGLADTSMPV